ncbi:MAG TPA: lytic murein transglycosylase [Alphaproteobacteria bacterium]|nr:lytic murein transglycosylase [Alphaproteobacteria bacterium]
MAFIEIPRCHIRAARRSGLAAIAAGLVLLGLASTGHANDKDFATWLQGVRKEALSRGISQATLNTALANVAPIPRVIELDHKQPEFTMTFAEYLARVVPESRVAKGRQLLDENRQVLEQVSSVYGVQPRFIVALWGIESDFGRLTGDFQIVPALATLAYDGRRSSYFRGELMAALKILDLHYIDLPTLRGSWAGAMGQNQFMPSSYLRYAVDFNGKGKRDIWHNQADVFASTANFLLHAGWHSDETWGREVRLPAGFEPRLADLAVKKPVTEWTALGVKCADGSPLPEQGLEGSIVLPGGEGGPAYIVYENYRAILKWNRSNFFATAAGLLADRIGGR